AYQLNPRDLDSGRLAAYAAIAAGRRSTSATAKVNYYTKAARVGEKLANAKPIFEHQLLAGESWLGAKKFDKALVWLKKAASKKPQNALVHYYIGQSYSQLGQFDQALASLQKALQLGPNADLRRQIYNNLGFVYAKKKNYDKALEMYKTAGNKAKVAEMKKAKETAAKNAEAKKEMREFKQKIKALYAQADELEKLGQVEEARQLREQADKLSASIKK
ncbi:MAG TPA: tetratricopeptide repeat protein, partial [Acidobacteria bacterium]|nr:tetratricopeptide repeat protein [Acidobacteriota bacterium]